MVRFRGEDWWLKLPTDVPANEYLTLGDFKFSSSFGNVISINEAAERYQVDAWRYALTAMAPETQDSEFTWQEFVRRVNTELVANWGNLVNRMLGFAFKQFDGRIPEPGELDDADWALLGTVEGGFESVGALYAARKFKQALDAALRLSQEVNRYVNDKAPWQAVKTDRAAAATSVYVCLQAIDWLKLLFAPVLPFSSQQVHAYLGYDSRAFRPSVHRGHRATAAASIWRCATTAATRPVLAGDDPAGRPGAAQARGAVRQAGRRRGGRGTRAHGRRLTAAGRRRTYTTNVGCLFGDNPRFKVSEIPRGQMISAKGLALLDGVGALRNQQNATDDDEDSQPTQRRHALAQKETGDQRHQHEIKRQEGVGDAQVGPRQHCNPHQRADGIEAKIPSSTSGEWKIRLMIEKRRWLSQPHPACRRPA